MDGFRACPHLSSHKFQSHPAVPTGRLIDKPEGDEMLDDPGNCHHCFCPASHWLNLARSWPAKPGKPIFRKVVEVAAKYKPYSERWLRLLQNISNTWGVTTRKNVNGWAVKQLIIWHEEKLEGSICTSIPCLEKFSLMFPLTKRCQRTLLHISQTQRPTSSAPSNTQRRLLTVQIATVGRRDFQFTIPDASRCPTEGGLHI